MNKEILHTQRRKQTESQPFSLSSIIQEINLISDKQETYLYKP